MEYIDNYIDELFEVNLSHLKSKMIKVININTLFLVLQG